MEAKLRSPLYVLLADDDADDRMIFEEAIQELNLPVVVTTIKDGHELMHYLTRSGIILPQILFLDLNMPLKNGFQCLQEIRSLKAFHEIYMVIYSTTARPADIQMAYDHGASLFIQKPNSYNDLKNLLLKILTSDRLNYSPGREDFVMYPE